MSIVSETLLDIFGFKTFRPHQEEIVNAILARRDVFAVMPTGGGKSLCYQLPACIRPGVTIVVSPLISLMKDQVDAAVGNGIGAASLNSTLGEREKKEVYSGVRRGDVKLLYISPERFNAPGFLEYLKTLDIANFTVDEAHCISEWGHDFRPDYLSLAAMTKEFPDVPVAAFTATATPRVADDILNRLGLRDPHLTRASFNRPNLSYTVREKDEVSKQMAEFIRERPGDPGIIYRTTRKSVEATTAMLRKTGIDTMSYHAGLGDDERHRAQEQFRNDKCQVVVATIAFGMGIDKPNVRFVIHGDLPKNLEGYYQETGRAGRDGEPAHCLLLHGTGDIAQLSRFNAAITDPKARAVAQEQLDRMARYARSDVCRRRHILEYFGETFPEENCGGCDICNGDVLREDATISVQKALSAMARTGGRFGAVHLTDILVGSATDKVRQNGHERLPTFGVGADRDRNYWRRVIEAAVAKGLAEHRDPRYPTPTVTEAGWEILRGNGSFEILKFRDRPNVGKRRDSTGRSRASVAGATGESGAPVPEELFSRLRKERSRLAEAGSVPPYVVFSDRSLREMARARPETDEELLAVHGVGQHKLKKYGKQFLAIIQEYNSASRE